MKRILILSALLLSALTVNAQYSVGSYPCGPASTSPLECNRFPISLNGVAVGTGWLHDYLTGSGPNWIIWQDGMSLMPEAFIGTNGCSTYQTFTSGLHSASQCTSFYAYFHGGGSPGDPSYYTGLTTLHFTYYYTDSGANWYRTLVNGAVTFKTY